MTRRTSLVAEMALTLALAAVLSRLAPWQMPYGGSVSLDMLPLIVFAVRRGPVAGIAIGAAYGFVDFLFEPYFLPGATLAAQAAQVALDYPVAFGAVGLAGLARRLPPAWAGATGGLVGACARFGCHFLSGFLFFSAFAPAGQSPALYSLAYNALYMVPSGIACGVLAAVMLPLLDKAAPVPIEAAA